MTRSDLLTRFSVTEVEPADGESSAVLLSGLAVPYGEVTQRMGVPIQFTADTTRLPEDLSTVKLLEAHDPDRSRGFAVAAEHRPEGLWMTFSVPTDYPPSADLLDQVRRNLTDGLSVRIDLDPETVDAMMARAYGEDDSTEPVAYAGTIREVSATSLPHFNGARLSRTFTAAEMSDTFTRKDTPPMPVEAPATEPAAVTETFDFETLAEHLRPFFTTSGKSALDRFRSFADFVMAGAEGTATEEERAAFTLGVAAIEAQTFALANQVTTDNPGVMQPTWLQQIVGIIDRGRPAITAFGGAEGAGDSGMSVNWPTYTGGFSDLVGVQATEKTEVTTRKVSIGTDKADLVTYAGASDISYQLLRRSSPSYREAYARILAIGYGVTTDAAFSAALSAKATPGATWDGATLTSLTTALFQASNDVDDAVGTPADVVLADPTSFVQIGVLAGVFPAAYGVQNVQGTAQASTLRINVSGLEIRKGRNLAAGTVLVGSSDAASWLEDGPFPIEQDHVALLGKDVGIWGMGTTKVTTPAGVQKLQIEASGGAGFAAASADGPVPYTITPEAVAALLRAATTAPTEPAPEDAPDDAPEAKADTAAKAGKATAK